MKRKLPILIVSALCVSMLYSCSRQDVKQTQADITSFNKTHKITQGINSTDITATTTVEDKKNYNEENFVQTTNEEDKTTGNLTQDNLPGKINASYNSMPLKQAIIDADLIAEVEILDKIKEIDEPMPKTIFKAKVSSIYKDNDGSAKKGEIQVLQDGNSKWVFNDHIMPQKNDRMLLILKKAANDSYNTFEQNTYWVLTGQGVGYGISNISGADYVYKVNAPENDYDGILNDIDITDNKNDVVQKISNEKIKGGEVLDLRLFDKARFIEKIKDILKKGE